MQHPAKPCAFWEDEGITSLLGTRTRVRRELRPADDPIRWAVDVTRVIHCQACGNWHREVSWLSWDFEDHGSAVRFADGLARTLVPLRPTPGMPFEVRTALADLLTEFRGTFATNHPRPRITP